MDITNKKVDTNKSTIYKCQPMSAKAKKSFMHIKVDTDPSAITRSTPFSLNNTPA